MDKLSGLRKKRSFIVLILTVQVSNNKAQLFRQVLPHFYFPTEHFKFREALHIYT